MSSEFSTMRSFVGGLLVAGCTLAWSFAARANVSISTAATSNMSCSAGVCSPTAKKAVVNVTDLASMLAIGDVKVTTGNGAVTITVSSPFSWTSAHRLTLDAYQTVSFRAPVTVAGVGAVTIATNDGGTGGDYTFEGTGQLRFWDTSSNLNINGTNFELLDSTDALVGSITTNPNAFYALAKDIHFAIGHVFKMSPIGVFGGTLEGLGHSVGNLSINDPHRKGSSGLFDTNNGSIRDIVISNAAISGRAVYFGALAGINVGEVRFASSSGTVSGHGYVGGLVGWNRGAIAGSNSSVALSGYNYVGGLVGVNEGGATIVYSYATGNIIQDNFESASAGGLVGQNNGNITQSHADGSINGNENTGAGGFVWSNDGTISNSHASGNICCGAIDGAGFAVINEGKIVKSFATGNVTGSNLAGGFVADNGGSNGGLIDRCFSTGSVQIQADGPAGGFAAVSFTMIRNSYSTGSVIGTKNSYAGGLVGENSSNSFFAGNIQTSYSTGSVSGGAFNGGLIGEDQVTSGALANTNWNLDTSGVTDPHQGAGNIPDDPGITGLTDAQLKAGLPAGFDPSIWGENANINNGYPYLRANPPPQ